MGAWRYEALDASGRTRSGTAEGDSPRQVRDWLRGQGLTPLDVQATAEPAPGALPGLSLRGRLPAAERALVLRQLATLLRAGLPLEEALDAVAEQAGPGPVRPLLVELKARVREGHDLAAAMDERPAAFPSELRAAVRAAERAGALDRVLERLAEVAERRQDLARGIGLALLYPVLVVIVALGVVTALMTWVVPRVVQVFASAGEQLPMLTRMMMSLSGFLQRNAGWLALLVIGLGALLAWGWRREAVRERLQGWALATPVLGAALRASATARACRSLGLQLASGVPLVDALEIASAAPGLVRFERALRAAAAEVREGASLSSALQRSDVFPPMAQRLVASGEKSGRLAELLEHAAAAQEREAATRAQAFGAVLQPVLILLVGAFVLLVVLAVMLPILDLNLLVS